MVSMNNTDATTARDNLIRANMPLVGYAVNAMATRIPRHVPREDLVSAGMLGLTQAARAYDESTGVPFNRFAKVRIQGALLDELRSRDWASRSVRRNARRMQAATEVVAARVGRSPNPEETAKEMGVKVADVHKIVDDVHRGTVLNYEALLADGPAEEVLPGREASPEAQIVARERRAVLLDAVAALPERLQAVVNEYFFEEKSMSEIAAGLGVTESRVSQMRGEAFGLIREAMTKTLDLDVDVTDVTVESGRAAKRRAAYCASVASASNISDRLAAVPGDYVPVAA